MSTPATNVVALKSGGAIAGIVPQSLDEAFRLANGIALSGLAPKGMDKPEQVMVAIMTGMELGLPPMFAVQKIAVINGRPSIWGDAIPALLWGKGFKLREWLTGEGDKRVAHCEITRPTGDKVERTFSVETAKEAGLWTKAGPWKQYPERMLQMRARGFAARDGAADVLGGLYVTEELDQPERDPVNITPRAQVEIPDLTAAPAQEHSPTEVAQTGLGVPDLDPGDEPLADQDAYIESLREQRGWCESASDVQELRDVAADMLERLSPANKAKALEILGNDE
jgi:hypothetical protein